MVMVRIVCYQKKTRRGRRRRRKREEEKEEEERILWMLAREFIEGELTIFC